MNQQSTAPSGASIRFLKILLHKLAASGQQLDGSDGLDHAEALTPKGVKGVKWEATVTQEEVSRLIKEVKAKLETRRFV